MSFDRMDTLQGEVGIRRDESQLFEMLFCTAELQEGFNEHVLFALFF